MRMHFKLIKNILCTSCVIVSINVFGQPESWVWDGDVSLKPFCIGDDKEILLNIDEKTGVIEGVISLSEAWIDTCYSTNGKYLFTASEHFATKIDLDAFKVLEEKKYYEDPVKEEWDDIKDKDIKRQLIKKKIPLKVNSEGDVFYFYDTKSSDLRKKRWLLTKEKDQELEKVKGNHEEWKKQSDKYWKQIREVNNEQFSRSKYNDIVKVDFETGEATIIFEGVNYPKDLIRKKNKMYFLDKDDTTITLSILNLTNNEMYRNDKYVPKAALDYPKFEEKKYTNPPTKIRTRRELVLIKNKPYAEIGNTWARSGPSTIIPINYNSNLLEAEKKIQFEKYDDVCNLQIGNKVDFTDEKYYLKGGFVKYKYSGPQPPIPPVKNIMSKKEHKVAMEEYEAKMKEYKKKKHDDYAFVFYQQPNRRTVSVFSTDNPEKAILKFEKIQKAVIYKEKYLLIDRHHEIELFDIEQNKTVWITELDF